MVPHFYKYEELVPNPHTPVEQISVIEFVSNALTHMSDCIHHMTLAVPTKVPLAMACTECY